MIEVRLRLPRRAFSLDVDLRLPLQGVTAILGPSGCGKTTVLRALAGLERAQGRVALGSECWQDDAAGLFVPAHLRPLGYVIQEAALFPHLSVQRNLDYGRRRSVDAARIDLDHVVELLGIGHLRGRSPGTLSGGERQRVAIARALATGPRLLLMDEPLAALDPERKAEILPYLERLHEELALPVVYVTHAIDEAARLADHLVLMSEGCVRAEGPLADLLSRADLPLSRLEEPGVVLDTVVAEHDAEYGLTLGRFEGGALWVSAGGSVPVGRRLRVRVLARDVTVARQRPEQTSVQNVLPVRLQGIQPLGHHALLSLTAAGAAADEPAARLLARVTRRSCDALQLQPGDALFAQVKGVAIG